MLARPAFVSPSVVLATLLLSAVGAAGQIFDTPGVLTPLVTTSPDATPSPDQTASPDVTLSPTSSPDTTGTPDVTGSPDATTSPDLTASPDLTVTATGSPGLTTPTEGTPGDTTPTSGTPTTGTPGTETPATGTPGGPTATRTPTLAPPPNLTVADGYALASVVTGLDFPTAIAFGLNRVWVSEAGALPGSALELEPRIRDITSPDDVTVVLSAGDLAGGALEGPLTDLTYHDGAVWLAHRQRAADETLVGAISRFDPADPAGTFTTVLTNLPSAGDWYTEEIVFDADGRGYFAQGSATNAGVVGPDNYLFTTWLQDAPAFHDYAPVDLVLNGTSFETVVPFALDPDASQITAPFSPFGSGPIEPGTTLAGVRPDAPQDGFIVGNAAIYSFDPEADDPESTVTLEAWGVRNAFGLSADPVTPGRLYVTNNGADLRAAPIDDTLTIITSRPLSGDHDDVFVIETGGEIEFFGWPDYFHDPLTGAPIPITDPQFCLPAGGLSFPCPSFVLDESFRDGQVVNAALVELGLHVAAAKLDVAASEDFATTGDLFIAESGAFVPVSGATEFVGYKIVRVDGTGTVSDFVAYETPVSEDELFSPTALNKPVDAKLFNARLFVVDFGVFEPGLGLEESGTGKVWSVVRSPAPTPTCTTDIECNDDGEITIGDLVALSALALGETDVDCPGFDGGDDGEVSVDEILQAQTAALGACGPPPATPLPTRTAVTPAEQTRTPDTTGTPATTETPDLTPGTPDATRTASPDESPLPTGSPDATGTVGVETPSPDTTPPDLTPTVEPTDPFGNTPTPLGGSTSTPLGGSTPTPLNGFPTVIPTPDDIFDDDPFDDPFDDDGPLDDDPFVE